MEQHPVPQNISSYEFRLVGDMTLKQFFQLSAGIILGIFFYRLPIISLVRYPLVFFSVIIGILMAFVPLQGRPFTQWIIAFIRAVYSPTEFVWTPPLSSPKPVAQAPVKPVSLSFFQTLKTLIAHLLPHKLKNISDALPSTPVPSISLSKPLAAVITPTPDTPQSSAPANALTLKAPTITTPRATPKTAAPPPPPSVNQTTFSKVASQAEKNLPPVSSSTTNSPSSSHPAPSTLQSAATVFESIPFGSPKPEPQAATSSSTVFTSTPPPFGPLPQAANATVSTDISAPTSPNILSGLVLDSTDKTLSGATIEIVDSATGIPVRALRSNRLGQFQIAIPLPAGGYIVNIEKEGFSFDPVAIRVSDSLIQPIMIKSRTI